MKIIWYDTLLSTNNTMSLDKERFQDRDTIVAIEQTAGKGQRGNRWESATGENLTFSTMLKPQGFAAERAWLISQSVSLGICDFLHIKGLEAKIKWPNDIYVGDKKICGILIENSISGTLLSSSIAGIGLNVNQLSFSEDIPNPISMAMVTGQRYDIKSEIVTLLESVFGRYDTISVKTGTDYLERMYLLGEKRTYLDRLTGERFEGTILGVTENGLLRIGTAGGDEKHFGFKEIGYLQ